ncbi:hypothetical protein POM88_041308 [Heracleum sosnowskyi]|uniref:PARP catalytic domain-containing protein n=1 Tax=Heracleum sosnowskyi TaxID=360622 RepID=A0AAD8MAL8_9APIA|nr:hypothetical protein POM88_041308 [Heracleum sosnowskyi]
MEPICAGSEQSQPSSEDFDTGVDNLEEPNKYIVWSCYMNTHIVPSFVISFKTPSLTGSLRSQRPVLIPKSPYMNNFPKLMSHLKTYLLPSEMVLIARCHTTYLTFEAKNTGIAGATERNAGSKRRMGGWI